MRNVKFRGKILQGKGLLNAGDWLEGGYYVDYCYGGCPEGKHYIITWNSAYGGFTDLTEVDRSTVGQFVGQVGDAKIHLWEGDIIEDNLGVGKVVYSDTRGAYRVTYDSTVSKWLLDYTDEELKIMEKLGNIHDNPELLEAQSAIESTESA